MNVWEIVCIAICSLCVIVDLIQIIYKKSADRTDICCPLLFMGLIGLFIVVSWHFV